MEKVSLNGLPLVIRVVKLLKAAVNGVDPAHSTADDWSKVHDSAYRQDFVDQTQKNLNKWGEAKCLAAQSQEALAQSALPKSTIFLVS